MKKTWIVFTILLLTATLSAQDLFKERIRKVDGKKRGVYLDRGVFSLGKSSTEGALIKIRHSFRRNEGFERIVFDFNSSDPTGLYSFMDKESKKLHLDFFKTALGGDIGSFGNSHYVKSIDIYPMDENQVSMEVNFKDDVSVEIFYLTNPGRLVIDVKK